MTTTHDSLIRAERMQHNAARGLSVCPSCKGKRLFMGGIVGWHCVSKDPTCATNRPVAKK